MSEDVRSVGASPRRKERHESRQPSQPRKDEMDVDGAEERSSRHHRKRSTSRDRGESDRHSRHRRDDEDYHRTSRRRGRSRSRERDVKRARRESPTWTASRGRTSRSPIKIDTPVPDEVNYGSPPPELQKSRTSTRHASMEVDPKETKFSESKQSKAVPVSVKREDDDVEEGEVA
jgi:hypothetical protein